MMENFFKNSLLGELKKNGIKLENNESGEYLPFGILTGNFEDSPFNVQNNNDDPIKKDVKIVKKRLNELDNNFFQETNYLDIKDDELTVVEKINKIKGLIKNIDEKIYMLEDSDDKILLEKLQNEREILEEAINILEDNQSGIKNMNKAFMDLVKKIRLKESVEKMEKIFFTIFPNLKKNFLVRKALNKLVKLNESVNNLCSKKIPYGESEGRYNDFIAYLSCANVIHAKLTKKI